MGKFKPSIQQTGVFTWVEKGKPGSSCIVEAVAGSGKTTTLIEALVRMFGDIFFGAFNKSIATEIEWRVKKLSPELARRVVASTFHAAGLRIWRRHASANLQIDSNKCKQIWLDIVKKEYNQLMTPVLSLVSLAKQSGFRAIISNPTDSDWINLIEHFNIDTLDKTEEVIGLAEAVLAESIQRDQNVVDYDDMIYAPLVHHCKAVKEFDWVLIDEAQDTNAARRALALLMLKRGGRLVAVGDPHQAIYGFTGADSNALDLIRQAVNAETLPLTVSYRCPKAITAFARQYVNHIQSAETAPEGKVSNLKVYEDLIKEAKGGNAILCRFNAPLMNLVYSFIGAGIPAKIEGRDIGNNLKTLARRWKVKTAAAIQDRLADYQDRETAKYRAKEKESMAVAIEDKVRCLNVIIGRVMTINPQTSNIVEDICAEIDRIFGDNISASDVILLSSIHKSKGREWPKVFWLQTGPSKWVRKEWEQQAEKNLCYVAITRAQEELVLVPMEGQKKQQPQRKAK